MAQIFKPKAKKEALPKHAIELKVRTLDHFGQGLARYQNRPLFIPGALPGEKVKVKLTQIKRKVAKGQLIEILEASPMRVAAHCAYFGECGGCSLQMLDIEQQRALKQENLKQLFSKFAGIHLPEFSPALVTEAKAYRRRARLHFMQDRKTKNLHFGFRKRGAKELVSINECPILLPELQALLAPLQNLFAKVQARKQLGHVELYQGESKPLVYLRLTASLGQNDLVLLKDFAQTHGADIAYKIADEAVQPLLAQLPLSYSLPDFDLRLYYQPGDFIQVNGELNQQMLAQAVDWLAPQKNETVLDLFCGIGNFSLALAKKCKQLLAIEGVPAMVEQARRNAETNAISNAEFVCRDLELNGLPKQVKEIDKVLLDPARPGALAVMPEIVKLKPKSVVYVSCDPVTLCRDSRILLDAGYRLSKIALLDMFPDTEHIETMVLFVQ